MKVFILLLLAFDLMNCETTSDLFSAEYRVLKSKYQSSCIAQKNDSSRMDNFIKNKQLIMQHNEKFYNGLETFSLEMNQFFDSTEEEVVKTATGFDIDSRREEVKRPFLGIGDDMVHFFPPHTSRPRSVSWVKKKVVNPIEEFTCCASDYASAALGALEAQLYYKTKSLKKFSIQNIVDCSRDFQNFGCEGGTITGTYNYIKNNKGLSYDSDYPRRKKIFCRRKVVKMNINITEVIKVSPDDENQLEIAVGRRGPIAAAIDASSSLFHFYKSGVYNNSECTYKYVNLAVLIVGYGTDKKTGLNYWLIKNSWGTDWGENGYMKLLKNGAGECGITATGYSPRLDPLLPI